MFIFAFFTIAKCYFYQWQNSIAIQLKLVELSANDLEWKILVQNNFEFTIYLQTSELNYILLYHTYHQNLFSLAIEMELEINATIHHDLNINFIINNIHNNHTNK